MKKMAFGIMAAVLLMSHCIKRNPVGIQGFQLTGPSNTPTINRALLGDPSTRDFSVGYQNGNIRSDQISIEWQKVADAAFVAYKIFVNDFLVETIFNADSTSFTDSLLFMNRDYNYKVAALLDNGMSAYDSLTLKTPLIAPPSGLRYDYLPDTTIRLYWTNNMESAAKFLVERVVTVDSSITIGMPTDTSIVDSDVEDGNAYTYRITACNAWDTSATAIFFINVNYRFNTPVLQSVDADPDSRFVTLEWQDNANAETGYLVYRDEQTTPIAILQKNQTTYTDDDTTNLMMDSTYTYWVRAFHTTDTTAFSNGMNVTIQQQAAGIFTEDFESFVLDPAWNNDPSAPWVVTSLSSSSGARSLRSGSIGNNQSTTISISIPTTGSRTISFDYRTSTEASFDFLKFYVNGSQQLTASGNTPWTSFTVNRFAFGNLTLTWEYDKDFTSSSGQDRVYIDNIVVQ